MHTINNIVSPYKALSRVLVLGWGFPGRNQQSCPHVSIAMLPRKAKQRGSVGMEVGPGTWARRTPLNNEEKFQKIAHRFLPTDVPGSLHERNLYHTVDNTGLSIISREGSDAQYAGVGNIKYMEKGAHIDGTIFRSSAAAPNTGSWPHSDIEKEGKIHYHTGYCLTQRDSLDHKGDPFFYNNDRRPKPCRVIGVSVG